MLLQKEGRTNGMQTACIRTDHINPETKLYQKSPTIFSKQTFLRQPMATTIQIEAGVDKKETEITEALLNKIIRNGQLIQI